MSLFFDASAASSRVDIGAGLPWMQNVPGGALVAWATFDDVAISRSIVRFQGNTGTTRAKISINTGTLLPSIRANSLDADPTSAFNGGGAATAGVRFYLAATIKFSAATGIIYLGSSSGISSTTGGAFANMTAGNTSNTAAALAKMGSQENGTSNRWLGTIEDCRIYNIELTANQVQTLMVQQGRAPIALGNMQAQWPLNELGEGVAVGASVVDLSNNKFNGTPTGTMSYRGRFACNRRRFM